MQNSERSKITVVGTKACNHRWHWKVKNFYSPLATVGNAYHLRSDS